MLEVVLIAVPVILIVSILLALMLRRVVPTNEVHIVQSSKKTTSYGGDQHQTDNSVTQNHGNTYYEWPSWMPLIGVTKIVLPTSVFQINLGSYDAYDKDRLPFEVDIVAFFRISDSNMAARRCTAKNDLQEQLLMIVKGVVRKVLASHPLDNIMVERATFGNAFTEEVEGQLKEWGVQCVKNIELMDIRDGKDNKVIHNIMEKKKSEIEMQSRTAVADNMQKASVAEIDAGRQVDMQKQDAKQQVGLKAAVADQTIGIAQQTAAQAIKEEERKTAEKEMAVVKVKSVQQAEITKNVTIVEAEQNKQTTILEAEGQLEKQRLSAEGVVLEGNAKAGAEKVMQAASVEAQIVLAKEIGGSDGYQNYLVSIRQVEANQAVGIAQAAALKEADLKIIANTGEIQKGVTNLMDVFTSSGGSKIGGMLEALKQSPEGAKLIGKFLGADKQDPQASDGLDPTTPKESKKK